MINIQNFVEAIHSEKGEIEYDALAKKFPYKKLCKSIKGNQGKNALEALNTLRLPENGFAWGYILGAVSRFLKKESHPQPVTLAGCLDACKRFLNLNPDVVDVSHCMEGFNDCVRFVSFYYKEEMNFDGLIPLLQNCLAVACKSHDNNLVTAAHSELLFACWETRRFQECEAVLQSDVLQISKGISLEEVLTYYYYAGCLELALERHQRAVDYFYVVLTAPRRNDCLSVIQIDTLKRFKLASLVAYGKVIALPKYITLSNERIILKLLPAYQAIEDNFVIALKSESGINSLNESIEKHNETFISDFNLGLVLQVKQAVYKWRILKLREVYTAIKDETIQKFVDASGSSAKSCRKLIEEMIAARALKASIDQDGAVSFLEMKQSDVLIKTAGLQMTVESFKKSLTKAHRRLSMDQRAIKKAATSEN